MAEAPLRSRKSKRTWYARSAAAFRWVHIYISMLSFAALMFFAFTGITLNHPTWLGGSVQNTVDHEGVLPAELIGDEPLRLEIAEWLRAEHRLSGRVAEFDVSEYELMVVFKAPGYAADVFVDRETAEYSVTETTTSLMAVMNDLHKGRDSGPGWSWLIDVSAVVMMVMSLSGFGLLFYLKKRRRNGLLVAVVGTLALVVVWAVAVP